MEKENKKKVTISLTQKSHEKIKEYAKEKHTSVSGAIEDWIWNELKNNDRKKIIEEDKE